MTPDYRQADGINLSRTHGAGTGKIGQTPFIYAFAIWGKRYVDYLVEVGIPSLLAPRNLPALPNLGASCFAIATTPEDEALIRSAPIFKLLERQIAVEFPRLPAPHSIVDKYRMLSIGHSIAADRAVGRGFVLFLGPDAIYPDGMLTRLYELAERGVQAVVGLGPRVEEESIKAELVGNGTLREGEPLIVPPREAASLICRHLHEDARILRLDSPYLPETPYMCLWEAPNRAGLLVRSFALHPYLVDYRDAAQMRTRPEDSSVVDGSYVVDCLIPWDKIYQVTDSDEFTIPSLTPAAQVDYVLKKNPDPQGTMTRWGYARDKSMLHRAYFMRAIKIHPGELDRTWVRLERETLKLSYELLGRLRMEEEIRRVCAERLADEKFRSQMLQEIWADRLDDTLPGDLSAISGRLAAKILARKVLGRLHPKRRLR